MIEMLGKSRRRRGSRGADHGRPGDGGRGRDGRVAEVAQIQDKLERRRQLDAMHTLALDAYDKADLAKARRIWERMLGLDPGNKIAQTWLENTKAEFERVGGRRDRAQGRREAQGRAEHLLNAPITISTDHQDSASEYHERAVDSPRPANSSTISPRGRRPKSS